MTLLSSDYKGITGRNQDNNAVCIPVLTPERINKRQNGRRFKNDGEPAFTLTAQDRHGIAFDVGGQNEVIVSGNPSTHEGIYVDLGNGHVVYAVWYEKYDCYIAIRKLTPRECFRLQGFPDELYERAEFVNSDTQLYKQAGNAITVPVMYEVGKRIK